MSKNDPSASQRSHILPGQAVIDNFPSQTIVRARAWVAHHSFGLREPTKECGFASVSGVRLRGKRALDVPGVPLQLASIAAASR